MPLLLFKNLQKEMSGDNVSHLHRKLTNFGFSIPLIESDQKYFGNDTEKAVQVFQQKSNLPVTGVVDYETGHALNTSFVVRGTIVRDPNRPLARVMVKAFDKDMRHEQLLGEDTSDENGSYKILYNHDQFRRSEKRGADLIIRAYHPESSNLCLGESELIFNAKRLQLVDVTVNLPSFSEYEKNVFEIDIVRENIHISDLTKKDIVFLKGETGISAQRIDLHIKAARLAKETDLPPAVFYGFGRMKLPTVLSDILLVEPEVQKEALKKAIKEKIIPSTLHKNLDQLLKRLADLRDVDPGVQKYKAKETLHHIGKLAHLEGNTAEKIAETIGDVAVVDDKLLSSLVTDGKLKDNEAKSLGLTVNLHSLFDENLELVKVIQNLDHAGFSQGKLEHIEDLVGLSKKDWLEILNKHEIVPPEKFKPEGYAILLTKKFEALYPSKSMMARLEYSKTDSVTSDLKDVTSLFKKNSQPFSILFNKLDLSNIDETTIDHLRESHTRLTALANTYPGLSLHTVLNDSELPANVKEKEIHNRIKLISRFHNQNPDKEFLFLDYTPESNDLKALDFNGFNRDQQKMVLKSVKAFQRTYDITNDSEHAQHLLASGFHSSGQIARISRRKFLAITGFDEIAGKNYHKEASALAANGVLGLTGLLQLYNSLKNNFRFENPDPAIEEYLKKIDGWESLFGSLDYCDCTHCRSIFSPAAYFVDLMAFLEKNVYFTEVGSDDNVAWEETGSFATNENHVLHLRSRRPDLWQLPLTCENTNTLIPYLDIINEVLENFIALDLGFTEDELPVTGSNDRSVVENKVYKELHESADSFCQPFSLALTRLALFLSHFDLTRGEISQRLNMNDADQAAAMLNLSRGKSDENLQEYGLIVTPKTGIIDLKVIYGLDFKEEREQITYRSYGGVVPGSDPDDAEASRNDVQLFLKATGLNRVELGQIISTHFIHAGNVELPGHGVFVEIRSEKRIPSGENASVQNDIERIHNLTKVSLDRIHRFTRLWRKLSWTIPELDLILKQLAKQNIVYGITEEILPCLVKIQTIQKRFGLSVEEVCSLWGTIPDNALEGNVSLFDRIFNLPDFVRLDDTFPKRNHLYFHPSFRETPLGGESDDDYKYNTYRLTAGLNIDDQILYQLITHLNGFLKIDLLSNILEEKSFYLSRVNLASLYRHAKLAKILDLEIPKLFQLIQLTEAVPNDYIDNFNDLNSLLSFYDWWKTTEFSLEELSLIIGGTTGDSSLFSESAQICEAILEKVTVNKSLTFSKKIFAYLEGVTETQSEKIIEENTNTNAFEKVIGLRYEISPDFAPEITTVDSINIPDSIGDMAEGLQENIYSLLIIYSAPGAIFDDNIFAELEDISREHSRIIVNANPGLIVRIPLKDTYRLTSEFTASSLMLPAKIPVSLNKAHQLLSNYKAEEVIYNFLSAELNIDIEKLMVMIDLAGFNLSDPRYTDALIEKDPDDELRRLIKALIPLSILLRESILAASVINFIKTQPVLFGEFNSGSITIENIRLITLFSNHLKKLKKSSVDKIDYYEILLRFQSSGRFYTDVEEREEIKEIMSNVLQAETGLVLTAYDEIIQLMVDPDRMIAPDNALDALAGLEEYLDISKQLGVSGEVLSLIVSNEYPDINTAANSIYSAFRSKYENEEKWQEKIEPFENKIRSRKRDGLTDYLLYSLDPKPFTDKNDLYHHFLLDVELEGCARTSRIVAANSSLQLYVHRILMKLEQNRKGSFEITMDEEGIEEWQSRRNYRVWEANRKVFLYPENYLEPDLRDNKTHLFKELESSLLQQEVDEDIALDAYASYMRGFDELASLKIAGSYHDIGDDKDVLHLFAVTSEESPVYFYRTIENAHYFKKQNGHGVVFNPWRKIDVQIPVPRISPIVFDGKLHIFWVQTTTRSYNSDFKDGSSSFAGYKHKTSLKFTTLLLDGTWTAPQEISLSVDPFFKDEEGVLDDPLVSPDELEEHKNALEAALEAFHEVGDYSPESFEAFSSIQSELLKRFRIPKYDSQIHEKPNESYTLDGYQWDVIYPEVTRSGELFASGYDFRMTAQIDLLKRQTFNIPWTPWTYEESGCHYHLNAKRNNEYKDLYCCQPFKITRRNHPEYKLTTNALCTLLIDRSRPLEVADNKRKILVDLIDRKFTIGPFARLGKDDDIEVVSGSNEDYLINVDGDLLYLQWQIPVLKYVFTRLGTTLGPKMIKELFNQGIDNLLDSNFQEFEMKEAVLPLNKAYIDNSLVENKLIEDRIDFAGPFGVYFQEIFFHIPFLIANHLNNQGKYAEAQTWYHYIFNPTAEDSNWRYLEFKDRSKESLWDHLTDKDSIETYKRDPFNPHAIARLPARFSAYQKSIVMKYIDNLLDWGDHLFAQDTMESINEASLLYVMAADILGKRPAKLGECGEEQLGPLTYKNLTSLMNDEGEFLIELQHIVRNQNGARKSNQNYSYVMDTMLPHFADKSGLNHVRMLSFTSFPNILETGFRSSGDEGLMDSTSNMEALREFPEYSKNVAGSFLGYNWTKEKKGLNARYTGPLVSFGSQIGLTFCVPENKHLKKYWDRVEDRLFKIRNCMNISGVKRQLSLFAPEIDPMLLVRAKAAGLSLEDVLNSISGNLPPYRFSYLIERAKGYVSLLQGFGGALLGALEKKDSEELVLLRMVNQKKVLQQQRQVRQWEVESASEALQSLKKKDESINYRIQHYTDLIDEKFNSAEKLQAEFQKMASGNLILASGLEMSAAISYLVPQLGSPFALKYGGKEIGDSISHFARMSHSTSNIFKGLASVSALKAGFARRKETWEFQKKLAEDELNQLDNQLKTAELRGEIANRSLEIHDQTAEQLDEVYEYYQDKFTNLGLYTWLSTAVQRLYREAYNNAYAMSKLAEQAYRFERGDDAAELINPNHWEASKSGLLAGERLMMDLQSLERKYLETNYRSIEINQAFSLTQIDPTALIQLKQTGSCQFSIPEIFFDLFYPGHYRRKIKAVLLTIPCITGPYTNVSANLRLTSSWLRNEPDLEKDLLQVPLSRTIGIATSTAQNDAGVFELNFRDERYMPFEGAGAISEWDLSLPKAFRQFDYQTINDVILHISYSAEEDSDLRSDVEEKLKSAEGLLHDTLTDTGEDRIGLQRVFSLRQEFSSGFNALLHSASKTPVTIELLDKHFPLFLKGKNLSVNKAFLILGVGDTFELGETVMLYSIGADTPPLSPLSDFDNYANFGNLPAIELSGLDSENPIGKYTFTIDDPGSLSPSDSVESDPSAIDEKKLRDIYLYIEYSLRS